MSESATTTDCKCVECHATYLGSHITWYYFRVAFSDGLTNTTSGPYCENCYRKGVLVSRPLVGWEANDE